MDIKGSKWAAVDAQGKVWGVAATPGRAFDRARAWAYESGASQAFQIRLCTDAYFEAARSNNCSEPAEVVGNVLCTRDEYAQWDKAKSAFEQAQELSDRIREIVGLDITNRKAKALALIRARDAKRSSQKQI